MKTPGTFVSIVAGSCAGIPVSASISTPSCRNSVLEGGFSKLTAGSRVTFAEEAGDKEFFGESAPGVAGIGEF